MAVERVIAKANDVRAIQVEIDRASPGAVIHLPAEKLRGNFVIDKPLTLRGAGADRTIVDGGGRGSVFAIEAIDADVRLEEMAIVNGASPFGGGISADNGVRLHLVGCLFERNTALNGRGGAICIDAGALYLSECTLAANRAYLGGAVFVGGRARVEIAASILAENVAVRGGALAITAGAAVDVWTSRLEANRAEIEGHHIFTHGARSESPRIMLSNSVLSATGAIGLAVSNHRWFKASIAVDNSMLGRAVLPLAIPG